MWRLSFSGIPLCLAGKPQAGRAHDLTLACRLSVCNDPFCTQLYSAYYWSVDSESICTTIECSIHIIAQVARRIREERLQKGSTQEKWLTILEQATDLLRSIDSHLKEKCGGDLEAQHEIVERVYVKDKDLVAMTLKDNCHLVLDHKTNGPAEFTVDPFVFPTIDRSAHTSGDDESRSPTCTSRPIHPQKMRTDLQKFTPPSHRSAPPADQPRQPAATLPAD